MTIVIRIVVTPGRGLAAGRVTLQESCLNASYIDHLHVYTARLHTTCMVLLRTRKDLVLLKSHHKVLCD